MHGFKHLKSWYNATIRTFPFTWVYKFYRPPRHQFSAPTPAVLKKKVTLASDLGRQVARLNGNNLFNPVLQYPVIPSGNVIQ